MTDLTGKCLCGAVRYTLRETPDAFGVCHCTMCQRVSGGVNMAFTVPADDIEITGAEHVRTDRSSDRAARSFCGICGSNLWYRSTDPAEVSPGYSIGFGSLDDKSGLRLAKEICIETKPESYALTGDHPRLTSQECLT